MSGDTFDIYAEKYAQRVAQKAAQKAAQRQSERDKREFAKRMLADGKLSPEDIAKYVDLPMSEIKAIAKKVGAK